MRPLIGVRELREHRMLTQRELAEAAGVSEFTIQRVEGGAPVRPSTGRGIAAALGVTVEELVEGSDPGNAPAPPSPRGIMDLSAREYRRLLAATWPEWTMHEGDDSAGLDEAQAFAGRLGVTVEELHDMLLRANPVAAKHVDKARQEFEAAVREWDRREGTGRLPA